MRRRSGIGLRVLPFLLCLYPGTTAARLAGRSALLDCGENTILGAFSFLFVVL
ncbi:uncharacterized protein J3D65DRAFT_679611 [Phyllosticta citribraziliensis]|uniref:Uncharacterized protein n=1 Tax=Phyllosticta citribraziliensis TaxID=989973 RepID=A0ABR1LD13_9PEZI